MILVSDALVSARHTGTCAWVIWSTMQLWSGEGIIPSTQEDLYSGLAEAYGIFVVLQFFQNYLSSFPLILPSNMTIKLYCDNQGVLDRVHSTANTLYPHNMIQDDYPIICETHCLLQALQPIKVNLLHIKGHQNKKKLKCLLTTPELLNVDCDKCANKLNITIIDTTALGHLALPASYTHLQIDHTIII